MLEGISTEEYIIFLPAYQKYKKDKNGNQRMFKLVTDKTAAVLCRI